MKNLVLWLLRLVLIAAPIYNIYIFATEGEGVAQGKDWWMDNALFIAWVLGAYALLLLATLKATINAAQIVLLTIGTVGLTYFYYTPDIYRMFLDIPFFQDEGRTKLPYIPYAFTLVILLLTRVFKRRFKSAAKN